MHDGLGQYLAALQMRLSLANQGNDALLAECQQLLGEANRLVRTMTFALSPPVLSDLGFPAAIDWLADEMKRLHNLTVRVDTQRLQVRLRDEAALILFRAVGELLTNVAKHAGVNEATLVVREEGDQLVLLVGDHGRGFSPEQLERGAEQQTFGLFNVRERVGHLGGGLTIASGGPGAAVTITVPLAAVAEPGSEPTDRG